MNTDPNCLFCKIVSGEIPGHKVYENDHVLAFLDIAPANHGHTLVIPKNHSENFVSTDEETINHVYKVAQRIAKSQRESLNADGINVTTNNGAAAGQSVFHWHVHVIPRYENDGHAMWEQGEYKEREAETVAEKIKSALT